VSRSVARGTMLGIAGQVWHLAAAFLLYAFLARKLGPAKFGDWRLALSILNWFELFVNAGLVKVATKAIAERPEERPSTIRGAYLGQMVLAAVLFVGALVLAGPVAASLRDPDLAFLLRVSALDIPLYAAFMVAAAVLLGVQRFERHAFGMSVYATAKLLAVGGLVWFGFSVPGALLGNTIASIVGFAATFTPWPRKSEGAFADAVSQAKTMGPASVPFLTQNLLEGLAASMDLWFLKRLVGSSAVVGLYGGAATLAEVPVFLFIGLNRALFPSIARVHAEGDTYMAHRFTRQGVRLALLVTVLGVGVIAATGEQALTLVYSASFAAIAGPLAVLMAAACAKTVWSVCTEVLMAEDRRRTALGIIVGALVVQVALLAALTRLYGAMGAAVAVAIASAGAATVSLLMLRDAFGARMLLTGGRAVLAAGVVGGVLWWIDPQPIALLVLYPLAAVVYVGLLWMLGEVEADDVRSIRGAFGRRGA